MDTATEEMQHDVYLSVLASDIDGSNDFYSSPSTAFREKLVQLSKRGVQAIFKAPPWTPPAPRYEQLNISTPPKGLNINLSTLLTDAHTLYQVPCS